MFTREAEDDAEVVGAQRLTERAATQLLRHELQQAHNENIIGGSFEILKVEGLK